MLIVEDRGRDWSSFSMLVQRGTTYELNIKDGGRDRSVFQSGRNVTVLTLFKPL
jgi:hypothetical protein